MGRRLAVLMITFLLSAATAQAAAPPSAPEFADAFIGATNAYASGHVGAPRFEHAHCVEAAIGRYMCAYTLVRNGHALECHLIQARWTPNAASTITITLASRTSLCGSLREALDSLRP